MVGFEGEGGDGVNTKLIREYAEGLVLVVCWCGSDRLGWKGKERKNLGFLPSRERQPPTHQSQGLVLFRRPNTPKRSVVTHFLRLYPQSTPFTSSSIPAQPLTPPIPPTVPNRKTTDAPQNKNGKRETPHEPPQTPFLTPKNKTGSSETPPH